MFDYGAEKNLELYNQITPKEYDVNVLKNIKVPTLIISGNKDALISEESINKLMKVLKNDREDQILESIKLDDCSHMDFLWSKDGIKGLYPNVDRFFRRSLRK